MAGNNVHAFPGGLSEGRAYIKVRVARCPVAAAIVNAVEFRSEVRFSEPVLDWLLRRVRLPDMGPDTGWTPEDIVNAIGVVKGVHVYIEEEERRMKAEDAAILMRSLPGDANRPVDDLRKLLGEARRRFDDERHCSLAEFAVCIAHRLWTWHDEMVLTPEQVRETWLEGGEGVGRLPSHPHELTDDLTLDLDFGLDLDLPTLESVWEEGVV